MPSITLTRLAPLTGVIFVVLLVLSSIIGGEPTDADEATQEVVSWWTENDSENVASGLLGGLAAAFLVWFGGSVRATLRGAEGEPGRVAAIAFGGFLFAALGGAMFSAFQFAAAETAGDVPAEVTQTLAVLNELFFIPFAVGVLLAFLATAVCILRHGRLPRWLGFAAILVAIGVILPPPVVFAGLIAAAVWIVVVSVLLFLREEPAAAGRVSPTGVMPS